MSPAAPLHGEIESPRPLRAPEGKISVRGWCVAEGLADAPAIRLATDAGVLPMTKRTARTDVPKLLCGQPAAARSGFVIEGRLPAGVHLARIEARLPDGSWQQFKTLSLALEPRPFIATIESPAASGVVKQRVHVSGWALHPAEAVKELTLRYGHQETVPQPGGRRTDVPRLPPDAPHAAKCGFKSKIILSAGRGPLRLKARLADGSVAIARTLLQIDVATDEHHGVETDFGATRLVLSGNEAHSPRRPAATTDQPRHVLFVLPGSFASTSALHLAALANELSLAGHACAVAVPHDLETLAHHSGPAFRGLTYAEAEKGVVFADGRGPDIIHAWTTRENGRGLVGKLRGRHGARVVGHLEDNERQILALSLGRPASELDQLLDAELDRLVPADLSHPRRSRAFLAAAAGATR